MLGSFISAVTLASCVSAAVVESRAGNPKPYVDLGYTVQGATIDTAGQYYNFSNIRFGQAPVGDLRFAPPVLPTGRNRTLNDGQKSVVCPQAGPAWFSTQLAFLAGVPIEVLANQTANAPPPSIEDVPPQAPDVSEDCLFLDVIVPEKIFDARRSNNGKGAPVMVWIYGGGYTGGSKTGSGSPAGLIARSQDDGADGVIFVAMNYRLGLFGWLSGPTFQESADGNLGLYDQRLALEWIQEYIHLFGGDKRRVTVFGESAGGGSIMHQITAYGGLKGEAPFSQAILQSPGFAPIPGNKQQEDVLHTVFKYASLVTKTTIDTVAALRALPSEVLIRVNSIVVAASPYGQFTFGPSVDGKFVPAMPGVLLLHGQFDKSVKVMVGHNADEGLLFSNIFVADQAGYRASLANLFQNAADSVIDYISNTLYPPVFDGSAGYRTQLQRTALTVSEVSFTCNTRFLDLAYNNQTYSYFFTVAPGLHGQDIPYTFYNANAPGGVNAPVAMALQDYLTSFAMNGNPNEPGVPFFPLYGANSTIINLGANLGELLTDTVANSRCDWWQRALYY